MYPKIILTLFISLLMCNGLVANDLVVNNPIKWDFGENDPENPVPPYPNYTNPKVYTKVDLSNGTANQYGIIIEWTSQGSYEQGTNNAGKAGTTIHFPNATPNSDLIDLDAGDALIFNDFMKVRNNKDTFNVHHPAKVKLSGFDSDYTYKIQWITSFPHIQNAGSFGINVTSDGASSSSSSSSTSEIISSAYSVNNHFDVLYSNVYTVDSGKSEVEFTFDGGPSGAYQSAFGVAGVVITASAIPELNNYSLLLGCFGLTWVMSRRRRHASSLQY